MEIGSQLRFTVKPGLQFITLKMVETYCHDAPKGVKILDIYKEFELPCKLQESNVNIFLL